MIVRNQMYVKNNTLQCFVNRSNVILGIVTRVHPAIIEYDVTI